MSASRESTKSVSNVQPTPTPEEQRLNELDLQLREKLQPGLENTNQLGLALSGKLLSGGELPGSLSELPGGISPEVTQDIVNQSLLDVRTNFQGQGILDSGVAQEIGARTAADIRTQSEQFNLQNLLQLLNLAVGSTAQVQAPSIGFGQQLSSRLAGLRSIETTGKSMTTSIGADAETAASTGAIIATAFCWVAAEIFDGWDDHRTHCTRYFILNVGPKWFKNLYKKHGEVFADYIHDKPLMKAVLRPLFETFAFIGRVNMEVSYG